MEGRATAKPAKGTSGSRSSPGNGTNASGTQTGGWQPPSLPCAIPTGRKRQRSRTSPAARTASTSKAASAARWR
eukprot:2256118-Lingulodinium_polyedra.AAC.1